MGGEKLVALWGFLLEFTPFGQGRKGRAGAQVNSTTMLERIKGLSQVVFFPLQVQEPCLTKLFD